MITTNYKDIIRYTHEKKIFPIYILMGEEKFLIDEVLKDLQNNILNEEERAFDESIIYGKELNINQIIMITKRVPIISRKHLIIIKEAQSIKDIEKLTTFLEGDLDSHIIVICHEEKSIDRRKKILKLAETKGIVFESKRLYEKDVIDWIHEYVDDNNYTIDPKSTILLIESLGINLYKIKNEIDKLFSVIKNSNTITAKDIEEFVGISNEYNIFELNRAINDRNIEKTFRIVYAFSNDPKRYPLLLILSSLYNNFQKILIYKTEPDKTPQNIASKLGINPYFVKDYQTAAKNYNIKECINSIENICNADEKLKGFYSPKISEKDILKELIFKIFN